VRESRPKVLFLTSPNNPDGSMITEADLLELLTLPVCILRLYHVHPRRHARMAVMQQFWHLSYSSPAAFASLAGSEGKIGKSASLEPGSRSICCQVLVVLDEAYIEFSEEQSRLGWPARYDNLVVLRTFSKSAGLAGELLTIHTEHINALELCQQISRVSTAMPSA